MLGGKLKEENAGTGQNRAGQEKSCPEDQGDAVLSTLKAHQRDRGEDKCQQPGYDLKIALQRWIGLQRDRAQPQREQQDEQQSHHVPKNWRGFPALRIDRSVAHKNTATHRGELGASITLDRCEEKCVAGFCCMFPVGQLSSRTAENVPLTMQNIENGVASN